MSPISCFSSPGPFTLKECLRLAFLLTCLSALPAHALAAQSSWYTGAFILKEGSAVDEGGGIALQADTTGKISFKLPVANLALDGFPLLQLELEGQSPERLLIFWRTQEQDTGTFQAEVAPPVAGITDYKLGDIPGWEGTATHLRIELYTAHRAVIRLKRVSLSRLPLQTRLKEHLQHWVVVRPWNHQDGNFITGTDNDPPYPTPFFAALAALGLGLTWGLSRVRGQRRFNWRYAGIIVLAAWILADAFWQIRLWNQVALTGDTFGGKTTEQKLEATPYAALIAAVQHARDQVEGNDPRVFVASSSDTVGMLSAYYLSPLNTYWHRHGPELPVGDVFESGDYILLISPSRVRYNRASGVVYRDGERGVPVSAVHRSEGSLLLRVRQ